MKLSDNETNQYLKNLYSLVKSQMVYSPYESEENIEGEHIYQTYGTINDSSLDELIFLLNIDEYDIVYDLGSGIGNVLFKLALSSGATKLRGYEIVGNRYRLSKLILNELSSDFPFLKKKIKFYQKDFSQLANSNFPLDATIIFTDSVMFQKYTLEVIVKIARKCPRLRYLVSMKSIESPFLDLKSKIYCDVSWGDSQYYIYSVKK